MSLAVFIRSSEPDSDRYYPVASSEEVASLWRPIIDRAGLNYLDYIVSAGLDLDDENFDTVLAELRSLVVELAKISKPASDFTSPLFRAERLVALVERNPPQAGRTVYIG
jgi:hypothetical protein